MLNIKNRLSTKIFLGIFVILMCVCITIYGMLVLIMPKTYEKGEAKKASKNFYDLSEELSELNIDNWEEHILIFLSANPGSVSIHDSDNKEIIEGSNFNIGNVNQQNNSEISETLSGFIEKDGVEYRISFNRSTQEVDQFTATFIKVLPIIIVIILIVSILVAFFYSRFLSKPIENITKVSREMADLNLTAKSAISRNDEIGMLSDNLNIMAGNLNQALGDLKNANDQLKLDMEKERLEEKKRKDFFAAVSHELKTPVTVLKGQLDGMICNVGKFADRDSYLQEAYNTTENVEKLIKEILLLSKLDTVDLNITKINLMDVVTKIINEYKPISMSKEIVVDINIDPDAFIQADLRLMKKVLSNIIGNAFKHSQDKAQVKIYSDFRDDKVILYVTNSHSKIREDEIDMLYEPFYIKDGARNSSSGSGLGLYIVKSILDLHNFSYKIKNTSDGVQFKLTFN